MTKEQFADDDSEMIKNGQCQMCGHSVTEGHNCWDGRYASDMIYLKPSQMMKRSDNIITKLPIKKGE